MEIYKPGLKDYGEYYQHYIDLAGPDSIDDVRKALQDNRDELLEVFAPLDGSTMEFRYREGAWSLKDMVQHITDTERVFSYRGLCIARGDEGPYPGYDHEAYAERADLSKRSKEQLLFDFVMVRNSMISMYSSLSYKELERRGVASGLPLTAGAIPYMMLGHTRHHLQVAKEKYLNHA